MEPKDLELAMDGLNDEERSAIRNLVAPAFLLLRDRDERLQRAGLGLLDSVFAMLRARRRLDQLLRRAA